MQRPAVSPFHLSYGATRLDGTITWYYRSATITGTIKAVSGTRQGLFRGSGNEAGLHCGPTYDTRTTPAGTSRSRSPAASRISPRKTCRRGFAATC